MQSDSEHSASSASDDESDSNAVGSSASNGQGTNATSAEHAATKQQTKEVTRLRLVVLTVLICSALGVSLSAYLYLTNIEEQAFQDQFYDDANKVHEAIGSNLHRTLATLDSVAVTLVSYARATNKTWPFVTLPNFPVRMAKLLPQSNAVILNVVPIVKLDQRDQWELYSVEHDQWVNESQVIQEEWGKFYGPIVYNADHNPALVGDVGVIERNTSSPFHLPTWQNFPVVANTSYTYNYDWMSISTTTAYTRCLSSQKAVVSVAYMIPAPNDPARQQETEYWAEFFRDFIEPHEEAMEPVSDIQYPIVNNVEHIVSESNEYESVGMVVAQVYWRSLIRDILPEGSNGIHVVVTNPCVLSFAYQIDGHDVKFLGAGDGFTKKYDSLSVVYKLHAIEAFNSLHYSGAKLDTEYCVSTIHVKASDEMKARFVTQEPIIFSCAILLIFLFTSIVFYWYDAKVERRQQLVMESADRSSAIVSSLFPTAIRDRLYPTLNSNLVNESQAKTVQGKLQAFLNTGTNDPEKQMVENETVSSSAIAELYPDTTVLFADISGFTAWSSVRNPCQVFQLLETLYGAFDAIAKKRGVFKVETIGDCYVAAVGLPVSRKHHAVVMARFANDIRNKMLELVAGLDKCLGPGTGDLALRVGINSGPTTAGVLRGEKSRFQLFGDTVNTAARMESNGERNKIQVSQKTAELLEVAGKSNWLTKRADKIECKGKGLMTTYWCEIRTNNASGSVISGSEESRSEDVVHEPVMSLDTIDQKTLRLVDWNADLLKEMIENVLSDRVAIGAPNPTSAAGSLGKHMEMTGTPVDEVTDILNLPEEANNLSAPSVVKVSDVVINELQELIASIAQLYPSNPFHNFDHCSHVTMSTKKLLSRIVGKKGGMTIDALTQFAIVFGALIHDIDHPGVSNAQLIKENSEMAMKYSGQSVAEQNSVDLAWQVLMQTRFDKLRQCLCPSKVELQRFRQVVVNVVMATDLFDKNLKAMRDARWEKSFSARPDATPVETLRGDDLLRRKTIVIELIIQASDVSHTMQHFTVYKRWNTCLLREMYASYQNGRLAKDPIDGWYEGELWFFDNYVIPLAQKLRECQVFGVSCDEFLDYAKDNRMEWEMKGRDIVQQAVDDFRLQRLAEIKTEPFEV